MPLSLLFQIQFWLTDMGIKNLSRVNFLRVVVVLIGFVLAAKLFFVQVIAGEEYRRSAEHQYRQPANRVFDRGSIFFQTKDGTLVSGATLELAYTLVINPTKIVAPAKTYDRLNNLWPLDEKQFLAKSAKRDDPYEEIAVRLPEEAARSLTELKMAGVELIEERFRSYPGGVLAAPVLGFMAYQGDEYAGRYGLEKQYEAVLRRIEPLSFTSFLSSLLAGAETSFDGPGNNLTGDVITTIEPNVQRFLEDQLETVTARWQTKTAGGIILDPQTGAIVALASRPTFDPGKKQIDLDKLTNPLIERVYEMGSIMKPLTIAAGLDAGVINEQTVYNDEGRLIINGSVIGNYDGRARGRIPLQEVLNQSLNTGAVFVMQQLGHERFRDYLLAFGLDKKTGIDLPGEVRGLVSNLDSAREIEYATASFGQGIAVTPLSITVALSSLANGGSMIKPYVVRSLRYQNSLTDEVTAINKKQVIKPETARRVTDMLVKVVDEALDGGRARLARYRVAAKTGTAQIPDASGAYDLNKYLHSFFGYFPASQPRFTVFLYALEPQGVNYASQTLTPPFSNLTKFLLNYYQVPPDR